MIDVHCHILPGIDDGPEDLRGSIDMAQAAADAGISTVVATPHLRDDFPKVKIDEVAGRVAELQAAISAEGIELSVIPGGEVSVLWALEASDSDLALASYAQKGRALLIETPTTGATTLGPLLTKIASRGYRVLLAHPERMGAFAREPKLLSDIIDRGVALQVNAGPLIATSRGPSPAQQARDLLSRGLISVVASDGHRGSARRPIGQLADAHRRLVEVSGPAVATRLVETAPAALITGAPLPLAMAAPPASRGLFRRR